MRHMSQSISLAKEVTCRKRRRKGEKNGLEYLVGSFKVELRNPHSSLIPRGFEIIQLLS